MTDWELMTTEERVERTRNIIREYPEGHSQIDKMKKQIGKMEGTDGKRRSKN